MASSDYSSTRRCALYTPGHTVHFIQARRAWSNHAAFVRAEVLAVEDDVIVVVTEKGDVRKFRNHDLGRLARIVQDFGPHGTLCGHGVLRIEHVGGGYMFAVKPDNGDLLGPCVDPEDVPPPPTDPLPEELSAYLLDRVRRQGGGIVALGSALRAVWNLNPELLEWLWRDRGHAVAQRCPGVRHFCEGENSWLRTSRSTGWSDCPRLRQSAHRPTEQAWSG